MTAQRPNIMLLQGEDVGLHLNCYPGNDYSITPNLNKLAEQGARFDNAFSHAPVCAPSRGGMVLGCYPWTVGNHHMRSTLLNPPRTFMHELVDAGYHVSWPTKLDFNFNPTDGWCTDVETWWSKPAPTDQPFMVYRNFHHTHESRMFREIPAWHREEVNIPDALKHDPDDAIVPPHLYNCEESRGQVADYHDALTFIDIQIGEVLQWLEESGQADNTIVIFLSDHGRGMPREKRWCYDAGIHMPLIIRWPEHLQPGSVIDDLVAWVDIGPTLLSIAGVSIPDHYQGQCFLGENAVKPREFVFAGRDRMDAVYDHVRAVRNKQWHYIRNYHPELPWAQRQSYMEQQPIMPIMREQFAKGILEGDEQTFFKKSKPTQELYDVINDPHMLNNLADDPAHQKTLIELSAALDDLTETYGDLALTTEEVLVENGLVEERIEEYRERYQPLPDNQRIGPEPFPLTRKEAMAITSNE